MPAFSELLSVHRPLFANHSSTVSEFTGDLWILLNPLWITHQELCGLMVVSPISYFHITCRVLSFDFQWDFLLLSLKKKQHRSTQLASERNVAVYVYLYSLIFLATFNTAIFETRRRGSIFTPPSIPLKHSNSFGESQTYLSSSLYETRYKVSNTSLVQVSSFCLFHFLLFFFCFFIIRKCSSLLFCKVSIFVVT